MINLLNERTVLGGTVKVSVGLTEVVRTPLYDAVEIIAEEERTAKLLGPGIVLSEFTALKL
ncbi:hypothetical protein HYV64_05180 [Candidatus Shapirobacteria bacterium]|nr:hypothetical protein [Candidatus Shapirobacteria bacterium]